MKLLRSPRMVAWYPVGEPTPSGMQKLFGQHPDTTVLVISRVGAEMVNAATLAGKYPRFPPLAVVKGDVESCSLNYIDGELKPLQQLTASEFPVFAGMRAFITKTIRKDLDYVNGMMVHIVSWSAQTQSIRVKTATGRVFNVTAYADPDMPGMVYYPLRIGYASTIIRMAGAELQHATIWLDVPNVAAAAYTAMSRVATMSQLKFGGKITADHFAPARE